MWFNIINLAALHGTSTSAVDKNRSCFSVNQDLADCTCCWATAGYSCRSTSD